MAKNFSKAEFEKLQRLQQTLARNQSEQPQDVRAQTLSRYATLLQTPDQSVLKKQIQKMVVMSQTSDQNHKNTKGLLGELLVLSAELKLWASLKTILDNGKALVDPNYRNENGMTALIQAVFHGDLKTVKLLLSLKVDTNVGNADGNTAIVFALSEAVQEKLRIKPEGKSAVKDSTSNSALKNRIDIIWLLINNGADIPGVSHEKKIPFLFRSLELGNVELVKHVLEKKPESVLHSDNRKLTSIRITLALCPQVFTQVLDLYIKYKGDLNSKENQLILVDVLEKISDPKERIRIMKILLKAGADPNLPQHFYFILMSHKDPEILELFLSQDKVQNLHLQRGTEGQSLLACAIWNNNAAAVKLLLLNKKFDLKETNDGYCLLRISLAPQYRNTDIAKALIVAGINPWASFKVGNILTVAMDLNDPELLTLALEKTPLPLLKEKINDTFLTPQFSCLLFAAYYGQVECLKLLLEANKKHEMGMGFTALAQGNKSVLFLPFSNSTLNKTTRLAILQLLIQYCPKEALEKIINLQESQFQATPLSAAATLGDTEAVSILLEHGSDQNIPNFENALPLHIAASNNYHEIVKLLLKPKYQPKINSFSSKIGTPLLVAASQGSSECIELLLAENNISLEDRIETQETALHQAAYKGHTACVKKLIEKKANMEAQERYGFTPLLVAAYNGRNNVVELLLNAGANLRARWSNGQTVIMAAALRGHLECVKTIYENCNNIEALLNEKSDFGLTALDFAGDPDIIEYLKAKGFNQGLLFNCRLMVSTQLMSDGDKGFVEKLIKFLDLKNDAEFELLNSTYFPVPLYANRARLELKLIVLKHQLYQILDLQKFTRDLIDLFSEIIPMVCQDFYFSKESGNWEILLQSNQTINLSATGLEKVLNNIKQNKHKANPNKPQNKYLEQIKNDLLTYSTENKDALKASIEASEINHLKNEMLNKQLSITNILHRDMKELEFLKEQLNRTGKKTENNFDAIELSYNNLLDKLKNTYSETTNLIQISFEDPKLRNKLEAKIAEFLDLLNEHKKIYNQLKEYSNAMQEKQAGITQANPAKKKTGHHKKHKSKAQPKKQAEATLPQPQIFTPPKTSQTATLQELIKTSEKQQTAFSKSKITAFLPAAPKPVSLDNGPLYYQQDRTYLKVPRYTLEHATNMGSLVGSKDALQEFKRTSEQVEIKTNIDQETALQALLGSLAQALESRKGLKEEWPDHIRNIIFKNEAILKKHFSEETLIDLITKINQKIERVATQEYLSSTAGRLKLEEIDIDSFLKKIYEEFSVPKFEHTYALNMIELSKKQIKKFKNYIQEQGQASKQNSVLLHAIGFAWARMGTYYSEIDNSKPGGSQDRNSSMYREFGNQYRHNDPKWKVTVLNFIEKTLRVQQPLTVLPNPQLMGNGAHSQMPLLTPFSVPLLHSHQARRSTGNPSTSLAFQPPMEFLSFPPALATSLERSEPKGP